MKRLRQTNMSSRRMEYWHSLVLIDLRLSIVEDVRAWNFRESEENMNYKQKGTYRPVVKDDKKITKRERRLGRVVEMKQVNYTQKEWRAKKRREAEARKAGKGGKHES